MAKTTVGVLNVRLNAQTAAFSRGMDRASKRTRQFRRHMKVAAVAVTAFGVIAGTRAARGLRNMVSEQLDAVDAMGKLSAATDTSMESIAGLQFAAQLAGTSTETMNKSIRMFVRRIGEAKNGAGEALRTMDMLGLSADRLANMDTANAIGVVADEINKLPTAADRAAAAYGVFGRSGQELQVLLRGGSKGIQEATKQTIAFGTALDREGAAKAEVANDAITTMKEAFIGAGRTLAIKFAPLIFGAAKLVTRLSVSLQKMGGVARFVFDKAWDYAKLFADGLQVVGQVLIRIRMTLLKIAEASALAFGGDEMAETLKKMRKADEELLKTFEGSAFSTRMKQFRREVVREMDAAVKAIMNAGSGFDGTFFDPDSAVAGRGNDRFRQVSLARNAVGGIQRRQTDLLAEINKHTQTTAFNTRLTGLN